MYAHKALEGLQSIIGRGHWTDTPAVLAALLSQGMRFHLGEGTDVVRASGYEIVSGNQMPLPAEARLPFPVCWFDYAYNYKLHPDLEYVARAHCQIESGEAPEVKRSGVLAVQSAEVPLTFYVISPNQLDGGAWYPSIVKWRKNPLTDLLEITPSDEKSWERLSGDLGVGGVDQEKALHYVAAGDAADIEIAISALMLLNCKNVATEQVAPPIKLNKNRQRRGKLPIFDYHILKVIAGKGTSGGSCQGDGTSPRVHLCRGHFKRYTDDKPLLGKHTGLYWWQPHVRGSKEAGVVHKDYSVEVSDIEQ